MRPPYPTPPFIRYDNQPTPPKNARPEEDAFAATAPGAMLSTKHGRHAKRSARALEASYVPADPTRQRVEEIIAVSGSGDAGAASGAPAPADVMYAADEDEAEQL